MRRFDMRVSLAVYFAAMIWGAVAHAETGMVTTMGVGSNSCGKFIAAIGKIPPGKLNVMNNTDAGRLVSENAQYQEWLMGFLTGMNAAHAGGQQIEDLDIAGIDLWMRNWCNKHPTKMVFDGAIALINEVRSNAVWGNANRQ
jgi:hypothetical protein